MNAIVPVTAPAHGAAAGQARPRRVDGLSGASSDRSGSDGDGAAQRQAVPAATERAAASRQGPVAPTMPAAPLIAQLLASEMHLPQTRQRRQAAPGDADLAYRRVGSLGPSVSGRRSFSV